MNAAEIAGNNGNEARIYPHARVRGLADWRPQKKTAALVAAVLAVLDEYADYLPLTLRQVFYRLVAKVIIDKTELSYDRLGEMLNRARRAGVVPFASIRDDGASIEAPDGFSGLPQFWNNMVAWAEDYRRERLAGQPQQIELWVEAGGMVPQAARVAHHYGITVYSAGGFDGVTIKHDAASRVLARHQPTLVLHVGDYDPSGLSIFDAAAEDVAQMVRDRGGGDAVTFKRVALTPKQIATYALVEAPPKPTDKRGTWHGGTVQAEALGPDMLAGELEQALREHLDLDVFERVLTIEADERAELLAALDRMNVTA
jgi:hypothetical protein